jgi:hypothetical protein
VLTAQILTTDLIGDVVLEALQVVAFDEQRDLGFAFVQRRREAVGDIDLLLA